MERLDLTASGSGVNLKVRVTPRASRSAIVGASSEGALVVRLSAPPVGGAANRSLEEFLAEALGIRHSQVRLVRGSTSRIKVVHVEGLGPDELLRRLALQEAIRSRQNPRHGPVG